MASEGNLVERFENSAVFSSFPRSVIREKYNVVAEALKPCSRFRSPLSWDERIDFKLSSIFGRLDEFGRDALLLTEGVPLNWQILLKHLHAQGVTDSTRFSFAPIRADMPKLISVSLSPHIDAGDTDGREVRRHGFGSTTSIEESMSRAVGEILERYFLTVYRRQDLYEASYREVKARNTKSLDIFELNDFLPWQKEMFPAFVRTDEKPITWVRGKELLSDTDSLIPAQMVYWNYRFAKDEMVLSEPNTNGCAGHFTRNEAILSALLELIQRDSFLIYWLNNLSPKRIDPSTIVDNEIKDFLLYLRRYELEYHFLNITTDVGVPVCACVLIDQAGGEPIIALGGAAGFSLKELIFQSAGEALAIHALVSSRVPYVVPDSYKPFIDRKVGRNERLTLWRGRAMYERFKFFLQGPFQSFEGFMGEATWYTTPEQRLAYIFNQFKKLGAGYEVYVFEVVHPVLQTLGFHVVRAIVPRLMHLYLNETMATLDAPRLGEVPGKFGYKAADTLNPWPHPFP